MMMYFCKRKKNIVEAPHPVITCLVLADIFSATLLRLADTGCFEVQMFTFGIVILLCMNSYVSEVGSLGYLVTNLVKNFVTNLVMNLVNHRIW